MIYLINRRLYNTIVNSYDSKTENGYLSDDQIVIFWLNSRGIKGINKISIKEVYEL